MRTRRAARRDGRRASRGASAPRRPATVQAMPIRFSVEARSYKGGTPLGKLLVARVKLPSGRRGPQPSAAATYSNIRDFR